MSNIHRYEAAVKLHNQKVVVYHNINTGLFKFHRFLNEKFGDKWIYYTVRRKENKEIIDTFKNGVKQTIRAVRMSFPKQRNVKDSGYFVRIPFDRCEMVVHRNVFFSDTIIIESLKDSITLPEYIFHKAVLNAIDELKKYYEANEHIISEGEIKLLSEGVEKVLITKIDIKETIPQQDYP